MLSGRKLLVVDDDPDISALLSAVLEECGAQVTLAPDAPTALKRLYEANYDCIVADLRMPMLDGFAFLKTVRKMPAEVNGQTPAVVFSAHACEDFRQRALRSGFQEVLWKPKGVDLMPTTIARLIQAAKSA